jgi:hypothetical protein
VPPPPTYTYTHCNKHTVHLQPERFNVPTLTPTSRAPSPLHKLNKHIVHLQPESFNIPTLTPPSRAPFCQPPPHTPTPPPPTHPTQPSPPPPHKLNNHTVHSQPERFNIPTLTAPSRAPSPYTHCKQTHRSLTTRSFQHPNTHSTQPCPPPLHTPTHTVNKDTVHSQPERFNIPTLTAPSSAPSPYIHLQTL